jgi:membrane-associated progesterone receptor component
MYRELLKMCMYALLVTGGPYSSFAGHDASRALAMFQTDLVKEEYDDLSDLDSRQMESVREWEAQLQGKFYVLG